MPHFSRAFSAFWSIFPIVLSASASAETAQPPQAETRPIAVVYSDKGPSGWSDLPAGAYRVPDSSVVISGRQKGGALGVMFGAVGIIVQSAANSAGEKGAVSNTGDALHIDVARQAVEITQTALKSDRYVRKFTATTDPGGPTLSVVPYLVITFVTDTDVRPYVFLKATLNTGRPGDASRSTRYICCAGQPLPLTGENGLTAIDGESLRKMVEHELETAVNLMLDDVGNPYVRDNSKMIYVEATFPFLRMKLKLKGYRLWEDQNSLIFATSGPLVFAGVEIMDNAAIIYTPAVTGK